MLKVLFNWSLELWLLSSHRFKYMYIFWLLKRTKIWFLRQCSCQNRQFEPLVNPWLAAKNCVWRCRLLHVQTKDQTEEQSDLRPHCLLQRHFKRTSRWHLVVISNWRVKINAYHKKSEYDQEILQSQTADKPVESWGRATQQSRDTRKTSNQLSLPHRGDCKTRIHKKT